MTSKLYTKLHNKVKSQKDYSMSPVNVPYIEKAKSINVRIFYVESNPVVKRSVYATPSTLR